jgi:hypothetical protein
LFGKSKAAAVANALVNTYLAITKALSATSNPFINAALATSVGATGFKQVLAIKSTKLSTEGSVATIGAGVSGGGIGLAAGTRSESNPDTDQEEGQINALNFAGISGNRGQKIIVNNQVNATVDREGIAIAVREGNDMLNSRGISVISQVGA